MQTVEQTPVSATTPEAPVRTVLKPPVECAQHRIYVWSSPAPYAVVIEEARSFQPR